MIITAPNEILSALAKPVDKVDSKVLKIVEEMKKTLESAKDPEGVGLAAPQIGESLRIFVAKPSPKARLVVFINPKIVRGDEVEGFPTPLRQRGFEGRAAGLPAVASAKAGGRTETGPRKSKPQKLEGCLSLKDIWGTVLRSPKVTLSYLDETGKKQTKIFKDFLATIIQHEYDHLNGILFPKRVLEQKGKLYKSSKDEKGEDIFEELKLV